MGYNNYGGVREGIGAGHVQAKLLRLHTVRHGFCMTTYGFSHPTLHIPIDDILLHDAKEIKFNGQS
jgi:hypothetical protein